MTAVLEFSDVRASYGPFRALFGVSFSIGAGEAVALVGSNGAGKTTVARVASGLVRPDSGSVLVDGVDMAGARAYRFARAGIVMAPEGRSVFASLTVEENLTLSFRHVRGRRGVAPSLARAYELFPVLGRRKDQVAGTMSGGEQRMLSLARVMVEEPKLLIADEISLGLAPLVVDQLYESLRTLVAGGTSLLIVEQQVGHALRLCDRVAVLQHGAVSWTGNSADAASRVEAWLSPTG